MDAQKLKMEFDESYWKAIALVPNSKPEIDTLKLIVETASIRSDKAAYKPTHHQLMVDLIALYAIAVQGVRRAPEATKYRDTQLAHALFEPLRNLEDGGRQDLSKEAVEVFVKDMRDGGLQRFLLAGTPRLINRLERVKLAYH